ncbi:aspartate racemase [Thozetella sp. PMI_491]|nr:aspartate racemase [Thozetella sp. PMI_491]
MTMKTLLLLGGMTPDVTVLYYNIINRVVRTQLGGRRAAPLYLYSADLEDMIQHASSGRWSEFAGVYTDPIVALTKPRESGTAPGAGGGAPRIDGVVVCAILAHKVSRQLSAALEPSGVPLLHIADYLSAYLKAEHPNIKRLGLIAPKVTMVDEDPDFFIGRLQSAEHGFTVLVPETEADIAEVNRGVVEEVAKGQTAVTDTTKAMFISQARALVQRGAQAVLLGSTDLGFVIKQEDLGEDILVIEPAALHAEQAAKWALGQ